MNSRKKVDVFHNILKEQLHFLKDKNSLKRGKILDKNGDLIEGFRNKSFISSWYQSFCLNFI